MFNHRALNIIVTCTATLLLCMPVASLTIILGGCGKKSIKAPSSPAVKVKVERVRSSVVSETAMLIGHLDSRRTVSLFPQVDGTISKILVRPGEHVRQGQLLLSIDSRKQQAVVAEKVSDLAVVQADYQKEVAKLASYQAQCRAQQASAVFDQNEFGRNYWLGERGVVSESSVDAYDRAYKVSLAKLQEIDAGIAAQKEVICKAMRAIEAAVSSVNQQQAELSFYLITAPFAGVMSDIPVKIGDYVISSRRLTAVSELKPLEVKVLVPTEMASRLRIGMILEILDSNNDKVIASCPVLHIDPITDQQNQSVLVSALFDNRLGNYRPDQSVSTRLILKQHPGIMIPTAALSFVGGQAFAYVVLLAKGKGPVAQQRLVKISSLQGNRAVVGAGIKDGEEIVVSGIQNVRDGSPLRVE